MSSIIQTIDGFTLKSPESIYNFRTGKLNNNFFNLIRFFKSYKIITSEETKEVKIVQKKSEVYVLIPEWLYWLMYAHGGYDKSKFETIEGEIDEWHLAKKFIYKTIDENCKLSLNKLK